MRVQEGYAPIHFAAQEASLECVDALLESGADVEVADEVGDAWGLRIPKRAFWGAGLVCLS